MMSKGLISSGWVCENSINIIPWLNLNSHLSFFLINWSSIWLQFISIECKSLKRTVVEFKYRAAEYSFNICWCSIRFWLLDSVLFSVVNKKVSVWISATEEILEYIKCVSLKAITANEFFVICFCVLVKGWDAIFKALFSIFIITFFPGWIREDIIRFTNSIEILLTDSQLLLVFHWVMNQS